MWVCVVNGLKQQLWQFRIINAVLDDYKNTLDVLGDGKDLLRYWECC